MRFPPPIALLLQEPTPHSTASNLPFSRRFKAHNTYKVLATMHRRMNGTGWPRRGGWDSYLVRRSQAELDQGRVYGIKSKEGRVEHLVLSSNNVCGRIPPILAKLESLRGVNLSDNHISGPIPVELGLLLQLQMLQLHGNNLRGGMGVLLAVHRVPTSWHHLWWLVSLLMVLLVCFVKLPD